MKLGNVSKVSRAISGKSESDCSSIARIEALVLRLLSDENFNADVVRGLRLREPLIDLLRVQDIGLRGLDDMDKLAWTAENDRIVLTHDRATMPDFAYAHVSAEDYMPGMFVLDGRAPVREMIQKIILLLACSKAPWEVLAGAQNHFLLRGCTRK